MRKIAFAMVASSLAVGLGGCPAPPTALARAQQAAQEFNQDVRFGRSEMLLEHVAPAARDDFAARHRAWGAAVRVADLEMEGMRANGDRDLEVVVRVAWYRPEEQELRSTTIRQSWRDDNGWQLVSERRIDGDVGLLGEQVVYQAPSGPQAPTQFPTVRLGGGSAVE